MKYVSLIQLNYFLKKIINWGLTITGNVKRNEIIE